MNTVLGSPTLDVTLIVPADPLSGLQASAFRKWMESILEDVHDVMLDLGRVEFMDSAGCGILLWLHKQLLERGGRLRIRNLTPAVRALFEVIRIHRVLHILPSAPAA